MTPDTDPTPCVVCQRQACPQMVCYGCSQRIADQLRDLPEMYAIAAAEFWPAGIGSGSGRSSERSLGFRVAALDGRTSRVALEALESWERAFREDWTPAEAADRAQRVRKAQRWADAESGDWHGVNLCGVVDWLTRNLDRIVDHPAADEFAAELADLHRAAQVAAREPREDVTVIECPADHQDGICGAKLRLVADQITCHRCGTEWDRPRLLMVARSADVEVWQPIAFVSDQLGIPARTLRHWAQHGHIRRRGPNLLWSSVVAYRDDSIRQGT